MMVAVGSASIPTAFNRLARLLRRLYQGFGAHVDAVRLVLARTLNGNLPTTAEETGQVATAFSGDNRIAVVLEPLAPEFESFVHDRILA